MKYLSTVITFTILFVLSAQTKPKYEDSPMALNSKGQKFVDSYSKQAIKELPTFDEKLKKKRDGEIFYIITRIEEGDKFEMMYVKISKKKDDEYIGTLSSDPIYLKKIKRGENVIVPKRKVRDWCIVDSEGNETGNLTGKAVDALQAGAVCFILSMHPEDGKFVQFKVTSVLNPQTKQEIIDIVPEKIIHQIEREAKKQFGQLEAGKKIRYNFINAKFPSWEVIK